MSSKILKSIHGRQVGLDHEGRLLVKGLVLGEPGGTQRVLPGPNDVSFFDDFFSLDLTNDWVYTEGTDAATSSASVIGTGVGGVLRLTTGDAGTGYAADAAQLTQVKKLWRAVNGNLCFEARVKLSAITTCYAFLGFTDTVAASLEQPILSASSANTLTTNATDAVGFMFDTNMASDNWWAVGVANNVDATAQDLGVAPVADTYETFRIELDTDGTAYFYRNGVVIGTAMTGAVTASVALTPIITVSKLSVAASMNLDTDYLQISCDRV